MAFPAAEVLVIYGCSETEPIATRRAEPTPPLPPTAGYCVGAVHPDLEIELADPQPFWLPTSGAQTSGAQTSGAQTSGARTSATAAVTRAARHTWQAASHGRPVLLS